MVFKLIPDIFTCGYWLTTFSAYHLKLFLSHKVFESFEMFGSSWFAIFVANTFFSLCQNYAFVFRNIIYTYMYISEITSKKIVWNRNTMPNWSSLYVTVFFLCCTTVPTIPCFYRSAFFTKSPFYTFYFDDWIYS